jgi:hypothetical protein
MRLRFLLFACLAASAIAAYPQSPTFSRFTKDLPQLLESDAATVLVRGLTHDFAAKLCARLGGTVTQEVNEEVAAWKARNEPFLRAATMVINEFADRHIAQGGETAKQSYLQMILRQTATVANQRVMRELNGANLENAIAPPERACAGLASFLRDENADFEKSPDITRALVPYMNRRGK